MPLENLSTTTRIVETPLDNGKPMMKLRDRFSHTTDGVGKD